MRTDGTEKAAELAERVKRTGKSDGREKAVRNLDRNSGARVRNGGGRPPKARKKGRTRTRTVADVEDEVTDRGRRSGGRRTENFTLVQQRQSIGECCRESGSS
jgi:hypothetical protein